MKKIKLTNAEITEILQYAEDHIVDHEKDSLLNTSRRLCKTLMSVVEDYSGSVYFYSVFNGDNLGFIVANLVSRQNLRCINQKHLELLENRINKRVNFWLINSEEESEYRLQEAV